MSRECPAWCLDPAEILRLLRWMNDDPENGPIDISVAFAVLEKPWHWDEEWKEMDREQRSEREGRSEVKDREDVCDG
jgi:hypothetical protein